MSQVDTTLDTVRNARLLCLKCSMKFVRSVAIAVKLSGSALKAAVMSV